MSQESNNTFPSLLTVKRFFSCTRNLHRLNNSHWKYANDGQMMMGYVCVSVCAWVLAWVCVHSELMDIFRISYEYHSVTTQPACKVTTHLPVCSYITGVMTVLLLMAANPHPPTAMLTC